MVAMPLSWSISTARSSERVQQPVLGSHSLNQELRVEGDERLTKDRRHPIAPPLHGERVDEVQQPYRRNKRDELPGRVRRHEVREEAGEERKERRPVVRCVPVVAAACPDLLARDDLEQSIPLEEHAVGYEEEPQLHRHENGNDELRSSWQRDAGATGRDRLRVRGCRHVVPFSGCSVRRRLRWALGESASNATSYGRVPHNDRYRNCVAIVRRRRGLSSAPCRLPASGGRSCSSPASR